MDVTRASDQIDAKFVANRDEALLDAREREYRYLVVEENRLEWIAHHRALAECHEKNGRELAEFHRRQAAILERASPAVMA